MEGTTVQREILGALQRIGFAEADNVRRLLEACAAGQTPPSRRRSSDRAGSKACPSRPSAERTALDAADFNRSGPPGRVCGCGGPTGELCGSGWESRSSVRLESSSYRPGVLLYQMHECGSVRPPSPDWRSSSSYYGRRIFSEQVRLIGVTFEPKSDDPHRLRTYGDGRNVTFDASTRFVRLDRKTIMRGSFRPWRFPSAITMAG